MSDEKRKFVFGDQIKKEKEKKILDQFKKKKIDASSPDPSSYDKKSNPRFPAVTNLANISNLLKNSKNTNSKI
jgi:hypothetical protein